MKVPTAIESSNISRVKHKKLTNANEHDLSICPVNSSPNRAHRLYFLLLTRHHRSPSKWKLCVCRKRRVSISRRRKKKCERKEDTINLMWSTAEAFRSMMVVLHAFFPSLSSSSITKEIIKFNQSLFHCSHLPLFIAGCSWLQPKKLDINLANSISAVLRRESLDIEITSVFMLDISPLRRALVISYMFRPGKRARAFVSRQRQTNFFSSAMHYRAPISTTSWTAMSVNCTATRLYFVLLFQSCCVVCLLVHLYAH